MEPIGWQFGRAQWEHMRTNRRAHDRAMAFMQECAEQLAEEREGRPVRLRPIEGVRFEPDAALVTIYFEERT
jgi:hypothetical protein